MMILTGKTITATVRPPFPYGGEFVSQFIFALQLCWFPMLISTVAFGFGAPGLQAANFASLFGALDRLGGFFVLASIREFAPFVTAVVVAGVAGTAITADLGARKIREELDALQVLGVDPIKNLVVPRFLALMLITGLLDIYALLFGIAGGVFATLAYNAPLGGFFATLLTNASVTELWGSILKTTLFGAIIAIVCSYKGMNASGGAAGVGRAVNEAVVIAFLGVFAFNYVFTQTLLATHPELQVPEVAPSGCPWPGSVPGRGGVARGLGEIAAVGAEQVGIVAAELPEEVVQQRGLDPGGRGHLPERVARCRPYLVTRPGVDEPGAQREPHQHVVGADLPALGVADLEPATPGADLGEQERLLGQWVAIRLVARQEPEQAARPPELAGAGREQRLGLPAVVALQAGGEVTPQGRPALRVGDGLAADPKQLGDALGRHVGEAGGGQEATLPRRRLEPHSPEQRAALERPLAADQEPASVARPVVDGAEKDRSVRVGNVGETRRTVALPQLPHPLRHATDGLRVDGRRGQSDLVGGQLDLSATTRRPSRCPRAPRPASCRRPTTGTSSRRRGR